MMINDIYGNVYEFEPSGYCNYFAHRGYLTEEQKKEHKCKYKECHYYFDKKPTLEEVDKRKETELAEYKNLLNEMLKKQEISMHKYDSLNAIDDIRFAHYYRVGFKNEKGKAYEELESAVKEMILMSGEVTKEELETWIVPMNKTGTKDGKNIAKKYKSIYGDYRVFVAEAYCDKNKCYLTLDEVAQKKCLNMRCSHFRKISAAKGESKGKAGFYINKSISKKYNDIIKKLFNENKITATEYYKLAKIKELGYIKMFLKKYNEGILLRDFYKKENKKEKIKQTIIEYEDVNINDAVEQMEREGKVDIKIKRKAQKETTIFEKIIKWIKNKFLHIFKR